jgi:hypothetical protein
MADWIFQGNGKELDLDAAIAASRRQRGGGPISGLSTASTRHC